jgi:hypothetical protein
MTPLDRFIDALASHECYPRQRGDKWQARCPVHGGRDRDSLTISEGLDGRVLVYCHSKGCNFDDILAAVGLEVADGFPREEKEAPAPTVSPLGLRPEQYRQPPGQAPPPEEEPEPEAVYAYTDADGQPCIEVLRFKKGDSKTFRQRRWTGGRWEWRLGDGPRPLYRLPELLAAIRAGKRVYLVEGEKAAEAVRGLGLVATTALGGACEKPSSWRAEWSEQLRDARVVILPDNDAPGEAHAATARDALVKVAASVDIKRLPGLEPKDDAFDWIARGGTREQLEALADDFGHTVLTMEELLVRNIPPKETLVDPWLKKQDMVLLHAKRGVGKTWVSLSLAVGLASGGHVIAWPVPEPRKVLYVDGEMPAHQMQDRFRRTIATMPDFDADMLQIINPDIQQDEGKPRPSLKTDEGRDRLHDIITRLDFEVVILDNLACLYGGKQENDAESWDDLQGWLLDLRSRGITTIILHHSGKGGAQRGTSHREDVVDTIVNIVQPNGYKISDGARFQIKFEKIRSDSGVKGGLREFEAKLVETPDGRTEWAITSEAESLMRQVADLTNEGFSVREIAAKLDIGKTKAGNLRQEASIEGWIHVTDGGTG